MSSFRVIILPLLGLTFHCLSQNLSPVNYTVKDGLTSNLVYKTFQDSKGFVWFTTDNGVSRFDGKEFLNFGTREGLPDTDVFDIAEDATGKIWLSCFNAQLCYIKDLQVHSVKNDSLLARLPIRSYFRITPFGKKVILARVMPDTCYVIDEHGRFATYLYSHSNRKHT